MNDAIGLRCGAAVLISLCAELFSTPAGADIFRCERNGKVTYTDQACGADAQPIVVAAPQTIGSTASPDLAKSYDERLDREHEAHADADASWLDQHAAAKADEQRITKAVNAKQVVAGMSSQQVRQAWGEPSDVQLQIGGRASRERWVYLELRNGKQNRRTVNFEDGHVVGGAAPAGSPRKSSGQSKPSKNEKPRQ